MRAILVSVGDELVLGQTVDTNSAHLAGELAKLGIATVQHTTVGDDRAAITAALLRAAREGPLVLVTGGIGPTADDLTREALADAMGVELVESAQARQSLETFFAGRGRPIPPRNYVQALHPAGSAIIDNPRGTAPGLFAKLRGAQVYVLPGVPNEMRDMFARSIRPNLAPGDREPILTAALHVFGLGESTVAQHLGEMMERGRNPLVGTTVSDGVCSVRIRASSPRMLEQAIDDVRARVGAPLFGRDDQTLPQATLELLIEKGYTVASAESCTGGLIGKLLTDIPGCSAAYLGGWITYSNAMKLDTLGVPPEVLEKHGAVSGPVAAQMARGAAERSGAACGLSTTGIAGPDGAVAGKPVGTVWIGVHTPDGTTHVRCRFAGDRAAVRDRAAKMALQLLRLRLCGEPFDTLDWIVPPPPEVLPPRPEALPEARAAAPAGSSPV